MVPLLRTKGATPTRAAAALLLMRPSSGTAAIEVSAVLSPMPLIVFKLGVAQLVTLTHELHHGVMSFAVRLAHGLQVSRDLVPDAGAANGREPAGLGVDHMLELVAAGSQLCQLLTHVILRQHHMSGLAATHFLGRGGVGGQQARVAGIGLGLRSDQLAIGGKARGVDHLDRQSRATQSLDQCFLVAAGRLDRDADDLLLNAEPRNEGGDGIGAVLILGGTTPMPRRFEA
jgi:hypothetical protein